MPPPKRVVSPQRVVRVKVRCNKREGGGGGVRRIESTAAVETSFFPSNNARGEEGGLSFRSDDKSEERSEEWSEEGLLIGAKVVRKTEGPENRSTRWGGRRDRFVNVVGPDPTRPPPDPLRAGSRNRIRSRSFSF